MKHKRLRERNWTLKEKELLKNAIQPFLGIITSRVNNVAMIEKKNEVWRSVASKVRQNGIGFSIPKLKQKWARIKHRARTKSTIRSKELSLDSIDNINQIEVDEQYFKKEKCSDSELSEAEIASSDIIQPTKEPINLEKLSFEDQIYKKKLEQIQIEIDHETELFEIKKQIELNKLELVSLQIKKELASFQN